MKKKARKFDMGGPTIAPGGGIQPPAMPQLQEGDMTPRVGPVMDNRSSAAAMLAAGGRRASPEEAARAEQMLKSMGMQVPKFTPADAPALRAKMAAKMMSQRQGRPMPPREGIPVRPQAPMPMMKTGGKVKSYAKGGSVRGGGCEVRGKTKGSML